MQHSDRLGQQRVGGVRHLGSDWCRSMSKASLIGGDDDASDNELETFPDDVPADFGGPDFLSPGGEKLWHPLTSLYQRRVSS